VLEFISCFLKEIIALI